jgi:hypothetical protein
VLPHAAREIIRRAMIAALAPGCALFAAMLLSKAAASSFRHSARISARDGSRAFENSAD